MPKAKLKTVPPLRGETTDTNLSRAKKRALVDAYKDQPCMDCGNEYPSYVMDCDHRDPSQKLYSINDAAKRLSMQKLLDELAKCDVVCANCHRIRTRVRGDWHG